MHPSRAVNGIQVVILNRSMASVWESFQEGCFRPVRPTHHLEILRDADGDRRGGGDGKVETNDRSGGAGEPAVLDASGWRAALRRL